ncbi:MAG: hypothetical protein AABZ30_04130 [Myxococcota bacterium]
MNLMLLGVTAALELLARGDFGGARAALADAPDGDAEAAEARALVARLSGDDAQALAAWRAHVAARPERACEVADALLRAGEIAAASTLGCDEVAARAAHALAEWAANGAPAQGCGAGVWTPPWAAVESALAAGRDGLADQEATRYAHASQNRAQAFVELAYVYAHHGRARRALGLARRAAAFGAGGQILGWGFLQAGRPADALPLLTDVGLRVRALRALGETGRARDEAYAALLREPMAVGPHLAMARAVADDDPRRARALVARAVALDPARIETRLEAAAILGRRETEPELRRLAVATGDGRLAAVLARAYRDAGAPDEARRWACAAGLRPDEIDLAPYGETP